MRTDSSQLASPWLLSDKAFKVSLMIFNSPSVCNAGLTSNIPGQVTSKTNHGYQEPPKNHRIWSLRILITTMRTFTKTKTATQIDQNFAERDYLWTNNSWFRNMYPPTIKHRLLENPHEKNDVFPATIHLGHGEKSQPSASGTSRGRTSLKNQWISVIASWGDLLEYNGVYIYYNIYICYNIIIIYIYYIIIIL